MKWAMVAGFATLWAGLFLLLVSAVAGSSARDLKPGDPAPDFALAGSDGKTHKLSELVGKQVVVLAWFPKAFTSG